MASVNHLQFLHNIQPVARGLTYLCMKIKALTIKKYYLLTRNYYLLIILMAVPFCVNVFVPTYTCFRLSTQVKKVTMLDVLLLNRSTVIYQPIPRNNLSSEFESYYRLVFQDKDNTLKIKVKDIRKIPVNRDLSVIHDNEESIDFILIGCKFLTDLAITNSTLLIALYNGQFNYTESLSVVMALRAVARLTSQQTQITCHWSIEPLPFTFRENIKKSSISAHLTCRWTTFVFLAALNVLNLGFAFPVMAEIKIGFAQLQRVSGMSCIDHFISTILFDFVLQTVAGFFICISLVFFKSYPSPMVFDTSGFFIVIVFSALASLPWVHSLQELFTSFSVFAGVFLLGRLALDVYLVTFVGVFPVKMRAVSWDLGHVMLRVMYPPYNLYVELYTVCYRKTRPLSLFTAQFYNNNCNVEWRESFPVQYSVVLLLQFAIWLIFVCIAHVLFLIRRCRFFQSCLSFLNLNNGDVALFEDRKIIRDLLFMKAFKKMLNSSPWSAEECDTVNNEVFGLLETSSLVKTSIINRFLEYYRNTLCSRRSGYCPPDPVLMDKLTVYETLTLFGRLRGLRRDDLHSQLGYYVHLLQLGDAIHNRISLLSLSVKKRLNVAIALIGNPTLLILNDPTELLDNTTTNIVWGMLRYLSRGHRFILIATKRARGCQHICTQLTVMHGVHLVTESDIQNIADKYFHGYTVSLKFHFTTEERNDKLRLCFSRLIDIFPDVEIFSEDTIAHFYFSSDDTNMSKLIAFLEDAKLYYCLWDYTIQQTKLDQILYYLAVRCTEQTIEILPEF